MGWFVCVGVHGCGCEYGFGYGFGYVSVGVGVGVEQRHTPSGRTGPTTRAGPHGSCMLFDGAVTHGPSLHAFG